MESPSKSSITYKDLRLAGYSGTKYDAEMLISQGLADGICQTQQPQPHPAVVTARSPSTTVPTATVNTALATAIIEDLPSSLKRGAAPPRQPPPNPPPPPPQVSE